MLAFEVVDYAAISHKPELQIPSSCLAIIIEETINLKNMFTNFTGECQSNRQSLKLWKGLLMQQ